MKSHRFAFAAAAVLACLALPAAADTKAEIQKTYNKLTAAMKNGDLKSIETMATPDFVMKEPGRTMNAKQAMAEMKTMFASGMKIKTMEMRVQKVSLKGKTATVNSTSSMDAMMPLPDGKMHHMVSAGTSRDILVKTPSGWKFKRAEMLSDKTTMDGKPFDPSKMGAPPAPSKPKP